MTAAVAGRHRLHRRPDHEPDLAVRNPGRAAAHRGPHRPGSARGRGRPVLKAGPPRTVSRPGGGFWHAAGMPRSGSAAPARDQPSAAVTVIVGEEELLV